MAYQLDLLRLWDAILLGDVCADGRHILSTIAFAKHIKVVVGVLWVECEETEQEEIQLRCCIIRESVGITDGEEEDMKDKNKK